MCELLDCFSKLPEDIIIEKIMPFVYNFQPKCLLRDIRSFTTDYSIVKDMYEIYYNPIIFFNDITMFCHEKCGHQEHIPSLGGIEYIFYRSIKFKDKPATYVIEYIKSIQKNVKWRHCRLVWGLFTPEERTRFINKFVLEENIVLDVDQWYGGEEGYTF